MRNKRIIITLVLMLAIGFAAVSTTLIINAIVGIGANQDNFADGVVFATESLHSSEGTDAKISESGRTITFTTQEMKTVGEEAKVFFKIKNYSQYNAILGTPAISCYYVDDYEEDMKANPIGTTHEYMKLIPGSELDGTTVNAGGGLSEESSVTVKQIKSYVGETQKIKFQCEINARALESESSSIEKVFSYNVTFDAGEGNIEDSNMIVKYGKDYGELPIPTRENYEFLGWYTEEGEKVESTSKVEIKNNHKLTAKWERIYNVTFNSNGGNAINTTLKVKYNKAYGELPVPIKQNSEFSGWYTEGGEKVESTSIVKIQDNHILTAKWRYKETLLNGAYPVIGSGMIPVTLANNGTVTMADTSNEWYNYENKKWANAVILVSNPSKSYKVGEIIQEKDIESYFVWIPKYKYKLWNVASTKGATNIGKHSIDIVFGIKNTIEQNGVSCVTPMTSGTSGSCANGEYMTHPAFISMGVNGLWVGKFETGYKGATSISAAQVNSNISTKIIVKPNVYSWRGNTIYNIFVSSYNYKRGLNSHMMKNTEWGAVAYLSHSKYGIDKEVNINNNSSYKTGYSGLTSLDQSSYPGTYGDGSAYNRAYNTQVGYLASTTGNITGIYDMSGGAYEYVASYISGNLKNSGFTATTIVNYNAKYFDTYNTASADQTYQYRILGDATGEIGPFSSYADKDGNSRYHNNWYDDYSYFVDSGYPWFNRGGHYYNGVLAGQFNFVGDAGSVDVNFGSRLVLTGQSI